MTEAEALKILCEIEAICVKYGLWCCVEKEKKPQLKMIRIKEISIKVDKNQ